MRSYVTQLRSYSFRGKMESERGRPIPNNPSPWAQYLSPLNASAGWREDGYRLWKNGTGIRCLFPADRSDGPHRPWRKTPGCTLTLFPKAVGYPRLALMLREKELAGGRQERHLHNASSLPGFCSPPWACVASLPLLAPGKSPIHLCHPSSPLKGKSTLPASSPGEKPD